MHYVVIVIGILLCIILHEIAHAIAMYCKGIEIEKIGIGIPSVTRQFKIKKNWPPIVLGPFPLGAYVQPTQKGAKNIELLSYKDQALIYGAGVLCNIFVAIGFILLNLLILGDLTKSAFVLFYFKALAISLVGCGTLWYFRRGFCAYFMPAIGVFLLPTLLTLIAVNAISSISPETIAPNENLQVGGPVAIGQMAAQVPKKFSLLFIANISLSLALFNMIPLRPLDGGHIMKEIMRRRFGAGAEKIYNYFSLLVFAAIFIFIISSDIWRLISFFR